MSKNLTLQRRHFEWIAEVIRDSAPDGDPEKVAVTTLFANRLYKTNPKFNATRFIRACQKNLQKEKKEKKERRKIRVPPTGDLSLNEIHQADRFIKQLDR